jgi:hypothetical protein
MQAKSHSSSVAASQQEEEHGFSSTPSQKARSECDELWAVAWGGGGVAFRWEPGGGIEAQKARSRATCGGVASSAREDDEGDWEEEVTREGGSGQWLLARGRVGQDRR